nr:unnamed protein product [Digitaria exilis]
MLIQSLFFVTAVLLLSSATADEVTAEVIPLYYTCSDDGGRYRDNSTYLSNLKSLADTLVANAGTPNSFTPGAVGQAPDAVYGFVLCRGDCTGASCRDGLRKAFDDTVHKGFVCPLYKDVTIYYEQYMLQFSGDDIRRNFTNRPAWVASNMNNVTGETGKRYREKVQKLIDRIMDAAANSPGRYGTGKAWFGGEGGVTTAYGLLQCTPDLQADDCRSCLAELVSLMPGWFSGDEPNDYRVGGRILGPRCNLRYEKELFFQETNATLHIDVPKNHLGRMEILLLTIAAVLSIIILISLLAWIIQRRKDNLAKRFTSFVQAWQLWEDGNSKQLIDNSLSVEEHHQEAEILRCVQIALLCVQENPEDRPDMREVVRILSNKGTQLDNPNQPAYFHEPIASNPTSTQYLTAIHVHTA